MGAYAPRAAQVDNWNEPIKQTNRPTAGLAALTLQGFRVRTACEADKQPVDYRNGCTQNVGTHTRTLFSGHVCSLAYQGLSTSTSELPSLFFPQSSILPLHL